MAYPDLDWTLIYKVNHALLLIIFLVLAALHAYWAFGGGWGHGSAIPTVQGRPTFTPSFLGTMAVASALLIVAIALTTITSPIAWIRLPSWAVIAFTGLVLALRSIGDFKLVGFFKLQSDSRFAQMDTFFYSPLCLVLAVMMTFLILFNSAR